MEVGDGVVETWSELRKLSGKQILASAERTVGHERDSLLDLLLHLAVIEQREDYQKAGQRSLWEYLVNTLRFPKCQTSLRYHSARLLVKFPSIAHYLADGRLSMTTLVLLKDILDAENLSRLLEAASGKTKDEVLVLVASFNAPIAPVGEFSPVPESTVVGLANEIVALRADGGVAPEGATPISPEADGTLAPPAASAGKAVLVMGARSIQRIRPVAPDQLLFTATVCAAFKTDLEELADALSHLFPQKNFGEVIHYCVKQALVRVGKRRGSMPVRGSGAIKSDRVPGRGDEPAAPGDEAALLVDEVAPRKADRGARVHIPADLEREVWRRDGSCRWTLENGQPCGSKYQCEIDHIHPVALGGSTVLSNLRLLCRMHNLEAERLIFGDAFVDRFGKAQVEP